MGLRPPQAATHGPSHRRLFWCRGLRSPPVGAGSASPTTSPSGELLRAAVVVLKELTNGLPVVRIGPCMAAAKPSDVPSIALDRGCFEADGCARGVVTSAAFTPAAHTLCAWLAAAADAPAVAPVAALVLEGASGSPIDRFLE